AQDRSPAMPATNYAGGARPAVRFLALHNPLHVQDYGEDYRPEDASGIVSVNPPQASPARYGNLVTQVDADGNDLGGIRNVFVQVPIATYTGWNLFNRSFFEDGFCTLQGSFIPFARTKAERLAAGGQCPLDLGSHSPKEAEGCPREGAPPQPRCPRLFAR